MPTVAAAQHRTKAHLRLGSQVPDREPAQVERPEFCGGHSSVEPGPVRASAGDDGLGDLAPKMGFGSVAAKRDRSPLSPVNLDLQIAALEALDPAALRAEWGRLYRARPPKKIKRDLLELAVAFKLQERVLGGLGASTRRRLTELTDTIEDKGKLAKTRTLRPRPGAKLMREWGGITHEVTVLEDGFSWRGKAWGSLSAIAQVITGTHWSGPRFFGLQGRGKQLGTAGQESTDA